MFAAIRAAVIGKGKGIRLLKSTRFRTGVIVTAGLLLFLSALPALQLPFRVYPGMEGAAADIELPPDYEVPGELVLGRLMYASRGRGGGFGGRTRGFGGYGGGNWSVDYPKGDRVFAAILRRLTVIDVRSVEQPVNPDDGDDIYYWPYLHVGMPGSWDLTYEQAEKIRDYLLRGGFMVCDSFFGTEEWFGFEQSLRRIFPDRPVVELSDDDAIFHTVYDLTERYQVGNWRSMNRDGRPYRGDGSVARWRGIVDDDGRIMIMMSFNSDLGDSMQNADNPLYPERYSALGMRLGVNYVVYAMTH